MSSFLSYLLKDIPPTLWLASSPATSVTHAARVARLAVTSSLQPDDIVGSGDVHINYNPGTEPLWKGGNVRPGSRAKTFELEDLDFTKYYVT